MSAAPPPPPFDPPTGPTVRELVNAHADQLLARGTVTCPEQAQRLAWLAWAAARSAGSDQQGVAA